MLLTEDKNLSEIIHMRRKILEEDKDVIHVDEAKGKITQNLIHQALETWKVLPVFLRPKGMQRNLNIPKGVMMAFFWTSSGETGT